MLKEIKDIDRKAGIMRITTLNERFYVKPAKNSKTGLPIYQFYPSSTWIAGYYPKGVGFYKWLAQKGWDEAEALKVAAGDKGSKVHYACETIDKGLPIDITKDKFINPTTGQPEELTIEEVDCVKSFTDFLEDYKPELVANEITIFGDGYAGTIDKIYRIGKEIWVVDIKTSKQIWEEQKLQLSSYRHAEEFVLNGALVNYGELGITDKEWANRKQAILQLGYNGYRTEGKAHYKFSEIEDKYELFIVAMQIWKNENPNSKPKEINYPLILKSQFRTLKENGSPKNGNKNK